MHNYPFLATHQQTLLEIRRFVYDIYVTAHADSHIKMADCQRSRAREDICLVKAIGNLKKGILIRVLVFGNWVQKGQVNL